MNDLHSDDSLKASSPLINVKTFDQLFKKSKTIPKGAKASLLVQDLKAQIQENFAAKYLFKKQHTAHDKKTKTKAVINVDQKVKEDSIEQFNQI